MAHWYYYMDGERIQCTSSELKNLALEGRINPQTVIETADGRRALAKYVKGLIPASISPPSINSNNIYSGTNVASQTCPNCGMSEPINTKVCSFCGTFFYKEPEVKELPPKPHWNKKEETIPKQVSTCDTKQTSMPETDVKHQKEPDKTKLKPVSATRHIIFAIFALCFCCLPLGIVSLVYALQINTYNATENYPEAQKAAKSAEIYSSIAFICPMIIYIIFAICYNLSLR